MRKEGQEDKRVQVGHPFGVTVENVLLVTSIPEVGGDAVFDLWAGDVHLFWATGGFVFQGVLFLEHDNGGFNSEVKVAQICGIESENGRPGQLNAGYADRQQSFIEDIRLITKNDIGVLGVLSHAFEGSDYIAEGKVTAAFIAARKECLSMGIGRVDQGTGRYELFVVDPVDSGWLSGDYLAAESPDSRQNFA